MKVSNLPTPDIPEDLNLSYSLKNVSIKGASNISLNLFIISKIHTFFSILLGPQKNKSMSKLTQTTEGVG